ncbi:hypothetical protein DKX38_001884 [Salix brachista]|uniref:Uncharacterized protein n=1 Tax=Salix brachista TaxID=2182728 RepID=A0A5N5NNF3_9ROSI|nr:hypothetical protein DKX38_001884 [Salix brachista]
MQTVRLISMKLMFERLNLQAELEFKSMRTPIQSTGPPKWGFPDQFSLPVLLYLRMIAFIQSLMMRTAPPIANQKVVNTNYVDA